MAVMKFAKRLLHHELLQLTCFSSSKAAADVDTGSNSSSYGHHSLSMQHRRNGSVSTLRIIKSSKAAETRSSETGFQRHHAHDEQTAVDCYLPYRDFTYIDDIVNGALLACNRLLTQIEPGHSIYNLGRGQPVSVGQLLCWLEHVLGVQARHVELRLAAVSSPDVTATWSDCKAAECDLGFKAQVELQQGLKYFAEWYKIEYGLGSN